MVFTEAFCDKILEILALLEAFENGEKQKTAIHLHSIPFDDNIEASINRYIHELCDELVEAKLLSVKEYKVLLKIRKTFLYIEYGINNDDDYVRVDFYLWLMNKKPHAFLK
jgi:hypothetical protein